jgi:hypothetical protein
MIREYGFITLKNNKDIHYHLNETPDGVFITSGGMKIKKVASSNRNYMQNIRKFNQFFQEKIDEYKNKGQYKRDSQNYNGTGETLHTSSYLAKPKPLTKLHIYSSLNKYLKEFQTHENISKDNKGQYVYDTTYYSIDWKPTDDGTRIWIEKTTYKKDGTITEQKLSEEINPKDKNKVKKLVNRFVEIYNTNKSLYRKKYDDMDKKLSTKDNDTLFKEKLKK